MTSETVVAPQDPKALLHLDRLTVLYSAVEDRITINSAAQNGETVVLDFSRRMVKTLIPHLTAWLEKVRPAKGATIAQEVELSFSQAGAQQRIKPQDPVAVSAEDQRFLVTDVDLREENGHYLLLIKQAGEHRAVVPFSADGLGQWLGLIYQRTLDAEWDLDVWPKWFVEAQLHGIDPDQVH